MIRLLGWEAHPVCKIPAPATHASSLLEDPVYLLLYGISSTNIHKLQCYQNTAAHLILQQPGTPSVQHLMDRFHWLPIRARIDFKITTLSYKMLSSGQPAYLREIISPYQPSRLLQSSNQLLLTIPRANLTIGQCTFSYSYPVTWNAIPLSVSTSKRRLKSFLLSLDLLPSATQQLPGPLIQAMLDSAVRHKFHYACILDSFQKKIVI